MAFFLKRLRIYSIAAISTAILTAGENSRKKQAKTTRCDFIEKVNDPHISRSCIANSWQSQLEAKPKQALSPEGQSWQVWLAKNELDGMFSRWIRETSDLKSQSSSCLASLWNRNHGSIICVWTLNVMKTVDYSDHTILSLPMLLQSLHYSLHYNAIISCFQPRLISHSWCGSVGAHLVSLVAVCCRDSRRSWSDCSGRMFFSSSSLLDGRLLSLMARESFRKTFMARVPSESTAEAK